MRNLTFGTRPEDAQKYFSTDQVKADLKGRTVRGGAATMLGQLLKLGLNMGSLAVLGRLLAPADYGLIAMVMTFTGLMAVFKDMGLSTATIQRNQINHEQISTLFWINVAVSLALVLLMAALAPVIAWFYNEPRLLLVAPVFAVTFLFNGLTVQHQALLSRQMRFGAIATIDIAALAIGVAVGVIGAWAGAGYWALVLMQIATAAVTMLGMWIACGWRPGPPSKLKEVYEMLRYGGNLTGFGLINYFARNADNVLIGRFYGSQQLGLYTRAYSLLLLPLSQVNMPVAAVAVPALSRLANEPERYRKTYLDMLGKVTMLTMPGVAFMIATADWLITLTLGPQWVEASILFAILGIAGLVEPASNTTGWLFMTQDRTRHMFQWAMLGGTLTVAAFLAGLPWGALGVSVAYAIYGVGIRTPLLFWFVGRHGPVRALDICRASIPATCAALATLGALTAFRQLVTTLNPIVGLMIAGVIALIVTCAVLAALPAGRRELRSAYGLAAPLLKRA
jgi:PST family polysaccharide transporter